jgi:hypothetical protein
MVNVSVRVLTKFRHECAHINAYVLMLEQHHECACRPFIRVAKRMK